MRVKDQRTHRVPRGRKNTPCGCPHNKNQPRRDSEPIGMEDGVPLMGGMKKRRPPNAITSYYENKPMKITKLDNYFYPKVTAFDKFRAKANYALGDAKASVKEAVGDVKITMKHSLQDVGRKINTEILKKPTMESRGSNKGFLHAYEPPTKTTGTQNAPTTKSAGTTPRTSVSKPPEFKPQGVGKKTQTGKFETVKTVGTQSTYGQTRSGAPSAPPQKLPGMHGGTLYDNFPKKSTATPLVSKPAGPATIDVNNFPKQTPQKVPGKSTIKNPFKGSLGKIGGQILLSLASGWAADQIAKKRNPNADYRVADIMNTVIQTGLYYTNPILGALSAPVLEGITLLAQKAAENNAFDGGFTMSNDDQTLFKEYGKWAAENETKPGYVPLTFDQWKEKIYYPEQQKKQKEQQQQQQNAPTTCVRKYFPPGVDPNTIPEYAPITPKKNDDGTINQGPEDPKNNGGSGGGKGPVVTQGDTNPPAMPEIHPPS